MRVVGTATVGRQAIQLRAGHLHKLSNRYAVNHALRFKRETRCSSSERLSIDSHPHRTPLPLLATTRVNPRTLPQFSYKVSDFIRKPLNRRSNKMNQTKAANPMT